MMVLFPGGKERTPDEYRALLDAAGFRLDADHPDATADEPDRGGPHVTTSPPIPLRGVNIGFADIISGAERGSR